MSDEAAGGSGGVTTVQLPPLFFADDADAGVVRH